MPIRPPLPLVVRITFQIVFRNRCIQRNLPRFGEVLVNGKLAFPQWQFNDTGDKSIPSLEDVLGALPDDLHPQAVAGFFLTPQPDLVLNGMHVSAKSWLEAGGSKKVVVDLAEGLAAGY